MLLSVLHHIVANVSALMNQSRDANSLQIFILLPIRTAASMFLQDRYFQSRLRSIVDNNSLSKPFLDGLPPLFQAKYFEKTFHPFAFRQIPLLHKDGLQR